MSLLERIRRFFGRSEGVPLPGEERPPVEVVVLHWMPYGWATPVCGAQGEFEARTTIELDWANCPACLARGRAIDLQHRINRR